MTDSTTDPAADAAAVAAIRAGDPAPWGEIFDRHRDRVWRLAFGIVRRRADAEDVVQATFLKAVESLDQLRDPAALRSWLLSIARRRALDAVRRSREIAHDPDDDWTDGLGQTHDSSAMIAGLRQDELSRLVTAAFDGLEPRDRAALELAERQELTGDELADALDVTRDNAYQLLHAARSRFEASVASLVVARQGRAECGELDAMLDGWSGELTPLLRKRLARHLRTCEACAETKRLRVSPAALLATLPVVAMSTLAVDQGRAAAMDAASVGTTGSSVSTTGSSAASASGGSSLALKVAAVIAALVIGGAAIVVAGGEDDPPASAAREVPTTSSAVTAVDDSPIAAPTSTTTSASTTSTTATSTTATSGAAVDFCIMVDAFTEAAAGGPTEPTADGLVAYIATVDGHLQMLLAAAGDDATPELEAYADAFGELVGLSAAEIAAAGDDDELRARRDALEVQLAQTCI